MIKRQSHMNKEFGTVILIGVNVECTGQSKHLMLFIMNCWTAFAVPTQPVPYIWWVVICCLIFWAGSTSGITRIWSILQKCDNFWKIMHTYSKVPSAISQCALVTTGMSQMSSRRAITYVTCFTGLFLQCKVCYHCEFVVEQRGKVYQQIHEEWYQFMSCLISI